MLTPTHMRTINYRSKGEMLRQATPPPPQHTHMHSINYRSKGEMLRQATPPPTPNTHTCIQLIIGLRENAEVC